MITGQNKGLVIGVDEVGRGCLAGPIYGCAYTFIVPDQAVPKDIVLRDSKKMTSKQREKTYQWLQSIPHQNIVVSKTSEEIDQVGIQNANRLVLEESLQAVLSLLSPSQQCRAIIDGKIRIGTTNIDTESVIQGDVLYPCVSAASIIAKVERDRHMDALAEEYSQYGWENNKGYGTLLHREAIRKYGITEYHRKSFLTKLLGLGCGVLREPF